MPTVAIPRLPITLRVMDDPPPGKRPSHPKCFRQVPIRERRGAPGCFKGMFVTVCRHALGGRPTVDGGVE